MAVVEKEVKKKSPFRVEFGFRRGPSADELRQFAESDPKTFVRRSQDLIESGEFSFDKITDIRPFFWGLADVKVPVEIDVGAGHVQSIQSSAFPLLVGPMSAARMNDAYLAVPSAADELVEEIDTNKKTVEYVALEHHVPSTGATKEGDDFPLVGAGEKRYEIRTERKGYRIALTGETLDEIDLPGFMNQLNQLGELAREEIEEDTFESIMDLYGSAGSPAEPYVFRPSGAGASLYRTSNSGYPCLGSSGNRLTNNALSNSSDLENARVLLAAMKNTRGRRINIPISECTVLVPDSLRMTAWNALSPVMTPGVVNEKNAWGPEGINQPKLVSTSFLDRYSTTAWYMGWFRKQFKRAWTLRLEYVTLGTGTESWLTSRIAFQARIAWRMKTGAVDNVYVVQNLVSTGYPAKS